MRVYISGPMTGIKDFNYPLFNCVAENLRAKGVDVENPAEGDFKKEMSWEDYMKLAIGKLVKCDSILMLPGWEKSKGARLEFVLAHSLDFKISTIGNFT